MATHSFCLVIVCIASIQVKLNERCDATWPWAVSLVVDCTDCPIEEPKPFDKGWFSHKFKGPAVRWEVATSIQTGQICWVNGPYAAGAWPDEIIFRNALRQHLEPNEIVHADRGYRNFQGDPMLFMTPNEPCTAAMLRGNSLARARHEATNGRFKRFRILSEPFRHELEKSGTCSRAVATLVQMQLQYNEPAFPIQYSE